MSVDAERQDRGILVCFEHCVRSFNARAAAELIACCASDVRVVQVDARTPTEASGADAVRAHLLEPLWAMAEDVHIEPKWTLARGGKVFSAVVARGHVVRDGDVRAFALWVGVMVHFSATAKIHEVGFLVDECTLLGQLGGQVEGSFRTVEMLRDHRPSVAVAAARSAEEQAHLAVVEEAIAKFNAHDLAGFTSQMSQNVCYLPAAVPRDAIAKEGVVAYFKGAFERLPTVHLERLEMWAAGTLVLGVFQFSPDAAVREQTCKEILLFELQAREIDYIWGISNAALFA